MGSAEVDDGAASTPPKLSLFSFPTSKVKLETPQPLRTTTISIPFQWEEAPGKPRPCDGEGKSGSGDAVRCLELPPRLLQLSEDKAMPSPMTVLDGSYVGRSLSLRTEKSFRSSEKVLFGSSRWGRFRKMSGDVATDNGFELSSKVTIDGDDGGGGGSGGGGGRTQVKMTRVRRKGRLLCLSHARSHMWASIYASLKQVVPWKNRTEPPEFPK
ncbi:hypothetical protein SLA2020_218840 [Shorea laevis]